ncbi:hypothetical protein ABZX98_33180 [Streptomyces sp. NPDC002992]|uniref:hypothetical protein n=1 Tax=Streptomyces sp. NPDC002992 TaxID=3154273 RepID=UPI0033BE2A63
MRWVGLSRCSPVETNRETPVAATTTPHFTHIRVPKQGPLTSEPPLADAAPLTSEPPMTQAAPLTSEPTAPGTAGGTESPGA